MVRWIFRVFNRGGGQHHRVPIFSRRRWFQLKTERASHDK